MLNLDRLPFDVLYGIAHFLDIEDVVDLSNTSRHIRFLLQEETLCRCLIENSAARTLEAQLAEEGLILYGQAIRRIYRRRKALAAGTPVSASLIGTGTDLVCNEGIVCHVDQDCIQVTDIHRHSVVQNIGINLIFRPLPDMRRDVSALRLLYYSDGVLALLASDEDSASSWLMVIQVICRQGPKHIIRPKRVENASRIFVRHTKDVLFYGTHTGTGSHGHREWMIHGLSLSGNPFIKPCKKENRDVESLESEVIQLHEFPGCDIGTTVAFKIHGDYFYALSNCSAFDVVEVDWTSFYHCIKIPIGNPRRARCEVNTRIYRRQHAEGPINDSWNELGLQVDERTNQLMIVEARTEWPTGRSSRKRTFYAQEISFPSADFAVPDDQRIGPPGDPFSSIRDDDSKWCPDPGRKPWQCHPEAANAQVNLANGLHSPHFILARTKFRTYNFTAGTFIDIVEDTCDCCKNGSFCLRLRAGSRRLYCPLPSATSNSRGKEKWVPSSYSSLCPSPIESECLDQRSRDYRYNPITMWPNRKTPCHKATEAHDIMNLYPDARTQSGVDLKAFADERSIVYLIRPSGASRNTVGKIVCISFDGDASVNHWNSTIGSKGLQSMLRQAAVKKEPTPVDLKGKRVSSPPMEDVPIPEAPEGAWCAYETVWDNFPDAHDLNLDEILMEWSSDSAL